MEDGRYGGRHAPSESPDTKQNLNSGVPDCDGTGGPSSDHGDQHGQINSEAQNVMTSSSVLQDSLKSNSYDKMYNAVYRRSKPSRGRSNPKGDCGGVEANTSNVSNCNLDVGMDMTASSVLQDSLKSNSYDKMYNAVYRRSKSSRGRSNPKGDCGGVEANTSNVSNCNLDVGMDFPEATTNEICWKQSLGLRATTPVANTVASDIKLGEDHDGSKDASTGVPKPSVNACNECPCEEWR